MGQIVIIEDLQLSGKQNKTEDAYSINLGRELFKKECKLKERQPRDISVWSKFLNQKRELKEAIKAHKKLMLSVYPNWTNKSDFYTQKALIWS